MLRWQVLNLIADEEITSLDELIERLRTDPAMQASDQSPSRAEVIDMLYLYQDMLPSDLVRQLDLEPAFKPK